MEKSHRLFVGLTCDGNRRGMRQKLNKSTLNDAELYDAYRTGAHVVEDLLGEAKSWCRYFVLFLLRSPNVDGRPQDELNQIYRALAELFQNLKNRWICSPENADVRFVHLGRENRLEREAGEVLRNLRQLVECTRHRAGMFVGLAVDYDSLAEQADASLLWAKSGMPGGRLGWRKFLPLAGAEHMELWDEQKNDLRQTVDVVIRTGEQPPLLYQDGESVHVTHNNNFLAEYRRDDTCDLYRSTFFTFYTREKFREDLRQFLLTEKRKGQ